MLVILDPCNLQLSKHVDGVVIRIDGMEGPFSGLTFMVPIAGESADALAEGIQEIRGNKPKVYGVDDLRRETGGTTERSPEST